MKKFLAVLLAVGLVASMEVLAFAKPASTIQGQPSFDISFIQDADYYKSDNEAFVFTHDPVATSMSVFSFNPEFTCEQMVIQPTNDNAALEIESMIMQLRTGGGSQEVYSECMWRTNIIKRSYDKFLYVI